MDEGENQVDEMPNRGLELQEFTVTDNRLRPEQSARITARMKNYHREIDLREVEIFNSGPYLEVEERDCSPSISELEGARQGIYPEIRCNWDVNAASSSDLGGFRERTEPVKLRISYNASVENQKALKADFRDIENIDETERISRSFDNGEVEGSMTTESPIAASSGNSIELSTRNVGEGRIDGSYRFSYTPQSFGENCPPSGNPIATSDWESICTLTSDSTGVRNLFFTIDYKYIKEPNLDITIVNRG